jgi:hypothetical protein
MDAPLITLDDAANTTDVYAFVAVDKGVKFLTTALAVFPFEEPGIGPNKFGFDDDVLYEIHVAVGDDLPKGRATFSYQFRFKTSFKNNDTVLQAFLGKIQEVDDAAQNLTQTYTVTRLDHRAKRGRNDGENADENDGDNEGPGGGRKHRGKGQDRRLVLGEGIVPPNNQGIATPLYNKEDDGNNPAKDGVASEADLDPYTAMTIFDLKRGYRVFAGQREDGFYADIHGVFDLLNFGSGGKPFDSQGGFNVHTMVLQIPVGELGGDRQVVGVYATTSRRRVTVLKTTENKTLGRWVQVGRQGNPLFCEGLVALKDKDRYNRTPPTRDRELFRQYAESPELAKLLNLLVINPNREPGKDLADIETGRTDIAGIFIPDLIKVDLSTGSARFAGGGPSHPTNPDDQGFSRLGIFGNDVLISKVQEGFGNGTLPGGWPNGRRFGDDVVDIAVTALISNLRVSPPIIRGPAGDNLDKNDAVYNKGMPYAGTPHNGRNHPHHGQ